jgi:predicted RNA-binding Zn-ribbon protein involved in translation (DUF1610 family)
MNKLDIEIMRAQATFNAPEYYTPTCSLRIILRIETCRSILSVLM